MKRLIGIIIASMIAIILISCKSNKEIANFPYSEGFLPTRIEKISMGGETPDSSEARQEMAETNYPLQSLWGTWVPESENSFEETFSAQSATYIDSETGEESEAIHLELHIFPEEIEFCPPWQETSKSIMSLNEGIFSFSQDMNEEEFDYENTVLGQALLNQGLGQGRIEYTYVPFEDPMEELMLYDGGNYTITYGMSGNTLAIGLISSSENEPEEFDIQEIDYEIEFTGWKLTLTYGDNSVTYIPKGFDQSVMIDLYENGLEPGYNSVGGIQGITYRDSLQQVMYDLHEGYVDANITFNEEGTISIDASNGNYNNFQYLLSSDILTLISGTETGLYSAYRAAKESFNISAGTQFLGSDTGASIKVNNELISFYATTDLQELLDRGFSTSVDVNQGMNSCGVSDEIVLEKSGANINVKVVNPWEKTVALRECKICDVYIDDTSGTITTQDDSDIGVTDYDTIENYFEAAYEKTPELLRYKVYSSDWENLTMNLANGKDTTYGDELLNIDTTEMELLYHFENGVLSAYEILCPELLYNGLQDNVNDEALADLDAATMSGIITTREDVLTKLKDVFDDEGISVEINEDTGEISMDSNILFRTDSYELSDEGKEYIDDFMGAYASVILDDSLKNIISEVHFEGHTDSSGSYDYNLELSQERSDAVLEYCVGNNVTGMDEGQKTRLKEIATSKGYSYSDLVYDSSGEEDKEASRRVSIKFYIDVEKI